MSGFEWIGLVLILVSLVVLSLAISLLPSAERKR